MTVTRAYGWNQRQLVRGHAGEAMADEGGYPGFVMIGAGIAVLGMFLVALGYGFAGWAVVSGIVFGILMVGGLGYVLLRHRKVKHDEGRDLTDQVGH
ncbi:hypothetical protein [Rhodococcus sp. HNM0569]|uniref:hypothetical protein n=1 Tax=Rhodococcus sp. HNM0569 TaxID=2716340 RepID=UPI00146E2EB7|nr:hypothetical protein [Rhodococcus sp. HNM0569]NLU84398.1 hypothetical protein [Rhodococcus sp. HNM0569]